MQGYSAKLPLTRDNIDGAYSLNKTKAQSIKQDLKMLVLTNPGERMMIPDYGVGIRKFLFSQDDNDIEEEIKSAISNQVQKYMSFIKISSVDINKNQDLNMINISISFYIPSLKAEEQLNFSLDSN